MQAQSGQIRLESKNKVQHMVVEGCLVDSSMGTEVPENNNIPSGRKPCNAILQIPKRVTLLNTMYSIRSRRKVETTTKMSLECVTNRSIWIHMNLAALSKWTTKTNCLRRSLNKQVTPSEPLTTPKYLTSSLKVDKHKKPVTPRKGRTS